jgi:pimeloyl-ACP methyl ester carboxylesterase
MSYLDEGSGDEAVVMVHGNPTWSFYYRNLVLGLRGKMRCIVPDHIGCGLSDKPQDFTYTLGEHIRNLRGLLDSLNLRKIHLIVHDWGGPIGLGTALARPEQLGRVVILNTAAFADTVVPWRIRLCRAPVIGEWLVRGFNGFAWPATWMSVTRPLARDVKNGFIYPYNNWANRIATHRFVVDIPSGKGSASDRALAEVESKLGPAPRPARCGFSGVARISASTGITTTAGKCCCRGPKPTISKRRDTMCSRTQGRNACGRSRPS